MQSLELILRESASRHKHLCPRQVLGARMSLLAAALLDLELPRADKRLVVIVETDGCMLHGIMAATGCHVGGRTLRILDFGKIAATFVDTYTTTALRLAPVMFSRTLASAYAPAARNKWEGMLLGYQRMPAGELFKIQYVQLKIPVKEIVSQASKKAICDVCGEEILNGREIQREDAVLCRTCAGDRYYLEVDLSAVPSQEAALTS